MILWSTQLVQTFMQLNGQVEDIFRGFPLVKSCLILKLKSLQNKDIRRKICQRREL